MPTSTITIINSKDHWLHGWFGCTEFLDNGIKALEASGLYIEVIEVENDSQLENVLSHCKDPGLVWGNAYFVGSTPETLVWLNDCIASRGLSYIGPPARALKKLIDKAITQQMMEDEGIPVPQFLSVKANQTKEIASLVAESPLNFPLVIKPSSESSSMGISAVKHVGELEQKAQTLISDFPQSDILLEQFLPSQDLTCAYFRWGNQYLLMPTWVVLDKALGDNNMLSRDKRFLPWTSQYKYQKPVTEVHLLAQFKAHVPKIAALFEIRDVTRVDARLDNEGTVRFFDINGMPGLGLADEWTATPELEADGRLKNVLPDSVIIEQCRICYPAYSREEVFQGLINTVALCALSHHDLPVTEAIASFNLFNMESSYVIKSDNNTVLVE